MQRAYLPRAPASARRHTPHPVSGHLCVLVEGVRYDVTKERFVVGRGGRASDLAIDDPGVSRQHAVIERAGGAYYLVDMGSTNGVEFEGERIARKEIAHGDRFRIGDHELEFLFG
jgi:pSer/pThr/pTyr-binding forkhead associated (FHA) protein